jgi:hypothetical protein
MQIMQIKIQRTEILVISLTCPSYKTLAGGSVDNVFLHSASGSELRSGFKLQGHDSEDLHRPNIRKVGG